MSVVPLYYSCHSSDSFSKEQFVTDHFFSYLISGTYRISDSEKEYDLQPGCFFLIRKNRLAKFIKKPPVGGEFRSISLLLEQDFLKQFSKEYEYMAEKNWEFETVTLIEADKMLKNFIESLTPYLSQDSKELKEVFQLKRKELVFLLLKINPALRNILFDFDEPGKVSLDSFMNANFQFNVSMERFAYLTGRSLATFKRDFKKTFHETPGKWLLKRRLKEAYYLINNQKQKPSDVYLELGFEDLSHFSFTFKKEFGVNPSSLI